MAITAYATSLDDLLEKFTGTEIIRNVQLNGGLVADYVIHIPKKRFIEWAEIYCLFNLNVVVEDTLERVTAASAEYAKTRGYWFFKSVLLVPIIYVKNLSDSLATDIATSKKHASHHASIFEVPVIVSGNKIWFVRPSMLDAAAIYNRDFRRTILDRVKGYEPQN